MEIYHHNCNRTQITVANGELDEYVAANDGGYGFRGIWEGKVGYASTNALGTTYADDLLDSAKISADINNHNEITGFFCGSESYPSADFLCDDLHRVEHDWIISFLKEIEQYCFGFSRKVIQVRSSLEIRHDTRSITNTHGLSLTESYDGAVLGLSVTVKDKQDLKAAGSIFRTRSLYDLNITQFSQDIIREALSNLGARDADPGTYPCILLSKASSKLFRGFIMEFCADSSRIFNNKNGEKVASKVVTIVDDPLLANGGYSRTFDGEGVASKRIEVIKNGQLTTLLYNLKSAREHGVKPTGHGFRPSLQSPITTSPTNLYVIPGNNSVDKISKNLEKGLVISDLWGFQSGINYENGDFSLICSGYVVKNGIMEHAFNQGVLNGNFFTLLHDTVEISNDLHMDFRYGYYIPSILVNSLSVSV